jgi:tetratricopeptide (TPR) repeat protein
MRSASFAGGARAGRFRALRCWCAIALLALLAGCAENPPPATPGAPAYPDFVYPSEGAPSPTPGGADSRVQSDIRRAWQLLQAGDTRSAEQAFSALVGRGPVSYQAEVGLGYVRVAQRRFKEALTRFDEVLIGRPAYPPALSGRGEALLGLTRTDEAVAAFEAAIAADPSLADLRSRVEVLRFSGARNLVGAAKRAGDAGRTDEARRLYAQAIAASPDSAFLYRDLALVELKANAAAQAVAHLRVAVGLDPSDVRSWAVLGDALEKAGEFDGAADAYDHLMRLDPSDAARAAIERVRERRDLAKLPPDYQAIPAAAQITRGDLAALIGVRFQQRLSEAPARAVSVITDARGHWAAPWIMAVARVGAMDAFPNHTFQPRTIVRRIDLAQVVNRLLDILGPVAPATLKRRIADVAPTYLGYPAISAAVASGVMPLFEGDTFQPSRPVGGAEAVGVIDSLERLLPPRGKGAGKTGT